MEEPRQVQISRFLKPQISAEIDHEAGGDNTGIMADKDAISLGLLSSLVDKIGNFDVNLEKRDRENATVLRELKAEKEKGTAGFKTMSILHPFSQSSKQGQKGGS